ncbi:MAG: sugar nucleotide-binding protein, partial [Shimia sp.]|nr:sugar nucleotide-binding protein [Shimia sp.]
GVMAGADAVVNCVGILSDRGKNTFDSVQHDGAERIARIAAEQGVATMVQLSAIADTDCESEYATSKALGEEGVLQHMPNAMILRPSVIFGQDDGFFNRFASMSRMGPFLPIVGGETKFQPVFVDDVAKAAVMGVLGQAEGVYELGGPEVKSLRGWVGDILETVHRKRIVMNLPFWVGSLMGFGFGLLQTLTFGLVHNSVLTKDQVKLLRVDNVVSEDAKGFAELGIHPLAPEAIIADYLWRFRPSGQYDAIKDSARNLKV